MTNNQQDAFSYEAYVGWQATDLDPTTFRAVVHDDNWNPELGAIVLIRRRVWARHGCHAIERFKEWHLKGFSENWLSNRDGCGMDYTCVLVCQPAPGAS